MFSMSGFVSRMFALRLMSGAKGVRRVPVVGRRMDAAQPEGFDLAELILGQSLRRIKEDRAPTRIVQSVLKSRDLVAQTTSR